MVFIQLLRIKQWIKNFFILTPLIFSGKFLDPGAWPASLWVMFGFSMITSTIYILNDIADRDRDKHHPVKCQRPLVTGRVSIPTALFIASACAGLGSLIITLSAPVVWPVVVFYVVLQSLYNFYTKNQVILDVLTVALGFLIRIWVGALAIAVVPSLWLQLCVFVLALFLGFTKRRYEMTALKDKAVEHRGALAEYTLYFLDQMIIICASLAIIFYGLYTISPEIVTKLGRGEILYSVTFVIYGMFRYLYLIHVQKLGDDPGEVLLKDVPLLTCVFLWLCFVMVLYKFHT